MNYVKGNMTIEKNEEKSNLTHIKYRPDIDGLRAIAVLFVVYYHAFPDWFKGGFIGVDIFFVISGFLISTIIFENLQRDSFSFIQFYSRRIRRIFPSLIIVLIASFTLGWVALFADEFKQLSKHILGGAVFISNFILWNESGYFDSATDTKPLLHLWSLGIEEQFYIIWPVLLWAAWKQKLNWLTVTLAIAAISFILNVQGVHTDAVATFYSPQTRFWELLIGSILAYITLYKLNILTVSRQNREGWLAQFIYAQVTKINGNTFRNVLSLLGFLAIASGAILITNEKHFPGIWALLPTLGTAFIISAGSQAWFNRKVLANRLLVWFGLISFPLYLWHWPLLSFARIVGSKIPTIEIRIAILILSTFLAWLTYKFIENPLRFGKFSRTKIITLCILMIAVGYVGYNIKIRDGLSFREVNKINITKESGYDGGAGVQILKDCGLGAEEKSWFAVCAQDSRKPIKYALLGDSKAEAMFSGIVRTSSDRGRWLFIGGNGAKGSLVPVISNNEIYKNYQPLATLAVKTISENKNIEKVVLVTATRLLFELKNDIDIKDLDSSKNYEFVLEGLQNTIDRFKATNKKIIIVSDNPTLPHPEDCLERITSSKVINFFFAKKKLNPSCRLAYSQHLELSKKYRDLLSNIEKKNSDDVKIFDINSFMCDVGNNICEISKNGKLLYSYSDHISDYAAGQIGMKLNYYLNNAEN